MKGLIYDIKKFAVHDGPGIRTTIFFQGCPLDCWWCQNPESISLKAEDAAVDGYKRQPPGISGEVTVGQLLGEIEKDLVFYEQSGGGVTLSGGEPLLQAEFAVSLLSACVDRGIHIAVDTSGYIPWDSLAMVLPVTDLFLYDIKLIDDDEHRRYTGVSNMLILENIGKLSAAGGQVVVRIPLIPGITDTLDNLTRIRDTVSALPNIQGVHLLPYNPLAEDKYRRWGTRFRLSEGKPQTRDELAVMKEIFLDFHVEVGG